MSEQRIVKNHKGNHVAENEELRPHYTSQCFIHSTVFDTELQKTTFEAQYCIICPSPIHPQCSIVSVLQVVS